MPTETDAMLAYGINLGGPREEWKLVETDEWDGLRPDAMSWYDEEDESDGFGEQACTHLLRRDGMSIGDIEALPHSQEQEVKFRYGVEFVRYQSASSPFYVVATKVVTVGIGHVEWLDLVSLHDEAAAPGNLWDEKLALAVHQLGVTPEQPRPRWLLCSYWGQ